MTRLVLLTASCVLVASMGTAEPPAPRTGGKVAFYSALGSELTEYLVDIDNAALVKQGIVTLPAGVQEAWPHPSGRYLYVTWSSGGPGEHGNQHGITAFRIDPATGALSVHGQPIVLTSRSVHMTVDPQGTHLLVAHNEPSEITVHTIKADGTLGAQVKQPANLDFGIYAHQVRIDASGKMVVLMARGNEPTRTTAEDPGALKIFGYRNGVLSNRASIAPGRGHALRVRHLDFHPTKPWVYVTLEAQNLLQVYRTLDGPTLSPEPIFTTTTLAVPSAKNPQAVSSIHVHPNGQFLYLTNRASGTTEFQGKRVWAGGENSVGVFAINPDTGEPTRIQSVDTHGFSPRTFAIDPSGRVLVVDNSAQMLVRDQDTVRTVPCTLSVFRIGADGKLEFARQYDQPASDGRSLFWAGMVALP